MRNHKKLYSASLAIFTALCLASCGGGGSGGSTTVTPPVTPPVVVANTAVDFGQTYQTIRGFGGSSAWISNFTTSQAALLFGTSDAKAIGLSILRVRIDPAGSSNWGTELNNAQLATAQGAQVIATPWTPPASMKSNNNVVMGSLNPASYGAYANYLESFVTYFSGNGVNLYAISLQNEPDANVTYESCVWTPAQIDTWVANNASVLTTKLMLPESQNFLPSYADPTLQDPAAASHVDIVAGHIYGVLPTPYAAATSAGKDLWMTEHANSETGITGAMKLAKELHDSMTTAGYNAYLWWWINNWTGGNYFNGLMDESGNITLNGSVMGQFSKFIRPGYQRVSAGANPQTNVYVSAYKGSGHYVVVAINTGTSAVSQDFTMSNGTATSVTPYVTSATQSLAAGTAITVTAGKYSATLPAQSVTTFVN